MVMTQPDETTILRQKAHYLVANREIPDDKRTMIENLMDDKAPDQEGRYKAVIDILEKAPPRDSVTGIRDAASADDNRKTRSIIEPVESSIYVENILQKYRATGLLKKRYFARRNNRFGIGCRKRCIPSKKLLSAINEITSYQEQVSQYLPEIFNAVLNDPEIQDPTGFNYLRVFRKWMVSPLFRGATVDTVKWMERHHFEKELRDFVYYLYSFVRMEAETIESVIDLVDQSIRGLDQFHKIQPVDNEDPSTRSAREKENLKREKRIHEYIMAVRSFLAPGPETSLGKSLRKKFQVNDLHSLVITMVEAMVFQRSFDMRELVHYFEIEVIRVSSENWDYSEDLLRKFGKDRESRMEKLRDSIRKELESLKTVPWMLEYMPLKGNLLHNGVQERWRVVEHRRQDVEEVYQDNYFTYLDGVMGYVSNALVPILDGSTFAFQDQGGERVEGQMFHPAVMVQQINHLNDLVTEMHHFKTGNPTLAISRKEVKKIMTGSITTMVHVSRFLTHFGGVFYELAQPLVSLYDAHMRWVDAGRPPVDQELVTQAITRDDLVTIEETSRPLPFYSYAIEYTGGSDPLLRQLSGRQIISENGLEGLFVELTAFCLQAAQDVLYPDLEKDLNSIRTLKKRLKDLA